MGAGFIMLSSKIVVRERDVYPLDFVLIYGGEELSKFYFPIMGWAELEKLVSGEDVSDQNEGGFFIEQKGKKVTIKVQAYTDCREYFETKFVLDHTVCRPAFEQLIPHYIKEGRDKEVYPTGEGEVSSSLDEETADYLEILSQEDENGEKHLKLIKDKKMTKEQIVEVFANFMNYHPSKLTVPLVKKFIKLGFNINEMNFHYWTDQRGSNALMTAVEYRNISAMKVLLGCGATVWYSDFIYNLLEGHSCTDTDILTQEQYDVIIEGLELLIKNEASVADEHLKLVKERYTETEYKKMLLDKLSSLLIDN